MWLGFSYLIVTLKVVFFNTEWMKKVGKPEVIEPDILYLCRPNANLQFTYHSSALL